MPDEPRPIRMAFEDGEIRNVTLLDDLPRPKRPGARQFKEPWTLVFDAGWNRIIDADLTHSDLRVFAALAQRSPLTGEEWEIRAEVLSGRLGMDTRWIRRCIKKLIDGGLIVRTRPGHVAFNPDLFWRGSQRSRVEKRIVEDVDA